jgi:NitT/TauT family transport system permease protein
VSQVRVALEQEAPRPRTRGEELVDDRDPEAQLRGLRLLALRTLLIAALLGAWQVAATWWVDPFWISMPSSIALQLEQWTASGLLFYHLGLTLQAAFFGLVLGSSLGVVFGFALGSNQTLGRVADPVVIALYSLPKVAVAPLMVLWFGIGIQSKIVLAAVTVFFLVFFNTYAGVREVDRDLLDVVRIMGASRGALLRKVVVPSALGWIFVGLKVAAPYALVGAVVGEIVASNRGIGYLVQHAAGQFDSTGVFAALFVLMVVSTLLNETLNRIEARLMRWKVPGR